MIHNCLKKLPLFMTVFLFSAIANAQLPFWTENFNNGCASNCIATTYNGWTILDNVDGTTGGAPNNWFVSCAEEGIAAPGCGSSCIGDATLHIGTNPAAGGDMGAGFNETGVTNATYRMAVSPVINGTGQSNITLKFEFIAYGSAACSEDRAQLRLSADGGATWPAGWQYCLTSVCCGACNGYSTGQWTIYTLTLPPGFDNNPNIRVGFHWRNNGNGTGTDPSVAIDDIALSVINLTPVTLLQFDALKYDSKVMLTWISTRESQFSHYGIERSEGGAAGFEKIGSVPAYGSQLFGMLNYTFTDTRLFPRSVYYRLKMVDLDGNFRYSKVVRVRGSDVAEDELTLLNTGVEDGYLRIALWAGAATTADIQVLDMQGRLIMPIGNVKINAGESLLRYKAHKLPAGYYTLRVKRNKTAQGAAVNLGRKFLSKP